MLHYQNKRINFNEHHGKPRGQNQYGCCIGKKVYYAIITTKANSKIVKPLENVLVHATFSQCTRVEKRSINPLNQLLFPLKLPTNLTLSTNLFPECMRSKASFILSSGIVWVINSSSFSLPAMYSSESLGILSRALYPNNQKNNNI